MCLSSITRRTDGVGLCTAELVLREVRVHLVAVEVRVVRLTVGVVQSQRLLAGQHARLCNTVVTSARLGATQQSLQLVSVQHRFSTETNGVTIFVAHMHSEVLT